MPENKNDKSYFIRRIGQMDQERQSFISHWKDLSEFIDPRRGRFLVQDRNKGGKKHNSIFNSRGTQALRNSQAGLFAGVMSPNRVNFKLEPLDNGLMSSAAVRDWTYKVETLMNAILLDSNFYSVLPVTLGEAIQFATGAMTQVEDFDTVARFYNHTAGSYWIGINEKCEVDTFVTERDKTVGQIVAEYGIENVSSAVKNLYDRGDYDKWYTVVQFIEPNPDADLNSPLARDKAWRSVSFEYAKSTGSNYTAGNPQSLVTDNKFLRKSGFEEFPVHCLRWATTGEDIYGTNSPGMVALGDIKALQIMEKRKAQAVDKLVNPPLKGPPSLRDVPITSLPGGVNIYDMDATKEGLAPIYQVDPRIAELREDIRETEARINEAFYVDLFLAITSMDGVQPRNQLELTQRNQERLLMLGPVLERIQQDFLGKVIQRTFNMALRAGIVPTPPDELENQSLNIRFVSALAQAQRSVETGVIERVAAFAGSLAQLSPETVDKFNFDEALEQYARLTGAIPSIIVPTEEAIKARQARAQQQQQMMQAEMAQQATKSMDQGASAMSKMMGKSNAR